jgi:uncharacterized caspase-like protein
MLIGTKRLRMFLVLVLCYLVLVACAATQPQQERENSGQTSSADLYIVDCLLPGQLRQVGGRTYLTPRRPTRSTAEDCRKKGGEYLIYDSANFESALAYWMPQAAGGDAEAQIIVGEFFEKGIAGSPDFTTAAQWYRKAAEQGNTRAQFNLGRFYEQGRGVEKDTLESLRWYRQAWGMEEDSLIFQSAMNRQLDQQRLQLQEQIDDGNIQKQLLEQQLVKLNDELVSTKTESEGQRSMVAQLEKLLAQETMDLESSEQQIAALPVAKSRTPGGYRKEDFEIRGSVVAGSVELGKYYALLIGNEHYEEIDDLDTPIADVHAIRDVLENQYGFSVRVVEDGGDGDVLAALNDLKEMLKEDDNLLIYYAGHGVRVPSGGAERGYWMPRNAEAPPRDTYWVPHEQIVGYLELLRARRVLVVADSCFAELLSEDDSYLFWGQELPDYSDQMLLEATLPQRARLLLSSGDDRPVLDGGGTGHSVFARAFIETLQANGRLLAAPELYIKVEARVNELASASGFEQKPQYKTIASADHRMGDFFFVPVAQGAIK